MPLPSPVKPGDVVLSRGTGWISRAICLIDDSEVSHAALALDRDRVAEAVGQGLRTINGEAVMDEHDLMVVRSLTSPAGMEPVIKVATSYLEHGHRYAHQQIVLLAVLCVSRRVPMPLGARAMVRGVLDQAAAAVNAMAERGQQPMVCSEFVYRCFSEAEPGAPYVLKIGQDASSQDGHSLLGWAQSHPALAALRPPSLPATSFDPVAAEKKLAPLVSAYAAATGHGALLGSAAPAVPGVLSDPRDEELLSSMAGFGTALHRARTGQTDAVLPASQAVEEIRDKQAEANFVTPGDLLRTISLTQIHRQTTGTGPARGMGRLPRL